MPSEKDDFVALNLDRAEFELRRGQGLVLSKGLKNLFYVFPMEFLDATLWKSFSKQSPRILCSGGEVSASKKTLEELAEMAYGANDSADASFSMPGSEGLLRLAKQAGILPIFLLLPVHIAPSTTFHMDISTLRLPPAVSLIKGEMVKLPIDGALDSSFISFRTRFGSSVHLALCVGNWQKQDAPLVRAHSSCVTGDILGSLRCDCGDQLQLALSQIKKEGGGILLYLHQEGRGIGISSKLRAYRLQEQGLDTFAANTQLGYHEDERDFTIASAMLNALNISRVRLLTNNPEKLAAMENAGITVTQRVPLIAPSGEHNQHYLDTKAKKHGHLY